MVTCDKIDSVKDHLTCAKHLAAKLKKKPIQPSAAAFVPKPADTKTQLVCDFVRMLASANIPISKVYVVGG